ncbi:unnamed protein product [Dovyalis caffra]|uniref:Uncharacterized protein n=1 Tax=Dovyalis caffra TaxID=77055 RepID=A0AAV1RG49_9ROSI|nr:unnamed protein product [Dovyalis caffra]
MDIKEAWPNDHESKSGKKIELAIASSKRERIDMILKANHGLGADYELGGCQM